MREIVISPETIQDIRRLCTIYEYSACFCENMRRASKNKRMECYACISKRIQAAIEPTPEVHHADDRT